MLWDKEGIEAVERAVSWPVKATTAAILGVFQIFANRDVWRSS